MKRHVPVSNRPGVSSAFGRLLKNGVLVTLMLVVTWLLSIVLEWIGMLTIWSSQGVLHSRVTLENERKYISKVLNNAQPSLILPSQRKQLHEVIKSWHRLVFVKSGLLNFVFNIKLDQSGNGQYTRHFISRSKKTMGDYFEAADNITRIFANRLTVLILASPLFFIVALVAVSNGLLERYKRITGVGREFAMRFHYLIPEMRAGIYLPWLLYLGMPFSVDPNYILLPFLVYFGLMVYMVSYTLKKHL